MRYTMDNHYELWQIARSHARAWLEEYGFSTLDAEQTANWAMDDFEQRMTEHPEGPGDMAFSVACRDSVKRVLRLAGVGQDI